MADKVTFAEMFLQLHRTYEDYHSKKETLVWAATSTYIAFVGVAMGWIFKNPAGWTVLTKWLLFWTLIAVCVLSIVFVWYQNWYKSDAVRITDALLGMLKEPGVKSIRRLSDLPSLNGDCIDKFFSILKGGRAGLILILLMLLLGIAQVLLVMHFIDP